MHFLFDYTIIHDDSIHMPISKCIGLIVWFFLIVIFVVPH